MRGSKSTYTPEIAELLFKRWQQCGQLSVALKRLGIHKATPYYWIKTHPEFAKRWEEAKKECRST